MAALTLEITPDLDSQLRREAASQGLEVQVYVLRMLRQLQASTAGTAVPRLRADEAQLLQEINRGLPAKTWQHYGELKQKRQAETLTAAEQAELIAISDRIEELNVRRMENVIRLARLRQTSVDALMCDLGIKSPMYD